MGNNGYALKSFRVKETKHGVEPKARVKFQAPCMDNVLFFFKEIRSTELILDDLGIPLSLEDKEDLLEIICYVSMLTKMPLESEHLLVCSVHCGL